MPNLNKSIVSRSEYVARLRRAFILRCHPDQFRQHDVKIRQQQSVLLQSLSERMTQADFQHYTSKVKMKGDYKNNNHSVHNNNQQPVLKYVLERRDRTLLHRTLDLNASVEIILQSLGAALEASGAAKISPPHNLKTDDYDPLHWVKHSRNESKRDSSEKSRESSRIDHRYDVNSNRGRELQNFLSSLTPNEIEERRAYRMDATAAALVARRLFSFQSIDGLQLKWSSKSFAGLLSSLIRFYEEHQHKFHVHSFYPLQLVFSHDERKSSLDIYGGHIYLNPSATQLEWLESIKEVTEQRLQEFFINRRAMMERVTLLQDGLSMDISTRNGIKLKKGFTCSSRDYHLFLERVTQPYKRSSFSQTNPASTSTDLMPFLSSFSLRADHHLRLIVESLDSCRRAKATSNGFIRIPSTITSSQLSLEISKLSILAEERWQAEQKEKDRSRQAIHQVQLELGVQNVFRHNELVSHHDFLNALTRLLNQKSKLGGILSGSSLRITVSGQFCHVSDDGSFIIPHNWK
mmetsp:Transcript_48895/g.55386  ORF Transcript_48895/g.55386 Transcript_48895/m.55386 type:complete len:519 (-) Transcript_48895:122-1678(-)